LVALESCSVEGFCVDSRLAASGVFVALTCFEVEGAGEGKSFGELAKAVGEELSKKYAELEALKEDSVVKAYRSFYWKLGIDPTKTRPAGEALARRLLAGKSLPAINPLVDAGNLASAKTLVPIGIYDADKLAGKKLALTLSSGGEEFKPIGGEPKLLEPGIPVLKASDGLVVHVYPHRDSVETAVGEATKKALVVCAGVPGVPKERVLEACELVVRFSEELGLRLSVLLRPSIVDEVC